MSRDPKPHPPTDHPPAASDLPLLRRRIRVARGLEPADLLLTGGQVVNVFTQRVEPAEIVVADGWIAGVGPQHWPAHQTLALAGRAVLPGLIDAHLHLESTLLAPAELARLLVPHGTTALISDPHEVGNVLGVSGIEILLAASRGLPLDLFFMAPSCVPSTAWEEAGAVLGPPEVRALLTRPRVLGLAEVMDVPAVLAGDPGVLEKIRAALDRGRVVDGHAPALGGRDLMAYAAVGIRSDHEATTAAEGRAGPPSACWSRSAKARSPATSTRSCPDWPPASWGTTGAWSPTTSSPMTSGIRDTSMACWGAWSPAASRRPAPCGTPRSSRPGTMG